ncbi:amidohydrolase family protein [Streptomyces sp. NPDC001177]
MRTVGLEEHLVIPDVLDAWRALAPRWQDFALKPSTEGETARRLAELGSERFAAMAETGLDVQVLSLSTPGLQNLAPGDSVALQTLFNDLLADTIRANPDRFQGLATLATPAPDKAAHELERAVTTLGLNGAMLYGRTRENTFDHPDLWPVFEAAAALRAPLYLHPQTPPPTVRAAYYSGLSGPVDAAFATHRLGWHYETGVQLLRLILSGVFDRYPDLQVIVGHWGEVILFYLERLEPLAVMANLAQPLSGYLRSNVFITPSGMFSHRYLRWAIEVVGVDRILFSTDYPFEFAPGGGARRFLEQADLSEADRVKIASGNWERVTAGIRR